MRDGVEAKVEVTMQNKSGSTGIVKKDEDSSTTTALGASFTEITDNDMNSLGIKNGVKVSKLGTGLLKSAGVKEGFIITVIDKKTIKTIDDVKTAIENKKGGIMIEGVYPNGMRAYYAFGM